MQVYTLVSQHVVSFSRIDEEIGLGAYLCAGIDKRECMLWNHHGVVHADDDLQFALQVFGFGQE